MMMSLTVLPVFAAATFKARWSSPGQLRIFNQCCSVPDFLLMLCERSSSRVDCQEVSSWARISSVTHSTHRHTSSYSSA